MSPLISFFYNPKVSFNVVASALVYQLIWLAKQFAMRWLLSGEQYFTHTLYAIKGSYRRGMNFTRFIGRKNIAQPTPSCILEVEPEKNLATFSRERMAYTLGQSWRCLCTSPTFPESVLHEKELASLSDSPHSLTVFSVLSWPSVVEYRPSEGRPSH